MKNFQTTKSNKGFTLIEVLIYIAISSVVIGAVSSYFFNLMKTYGVGRNQLVITNNLSSIMEKMSLDLRYADDVDDAACVFNSDLGTLVVNKGTDSYTYSISGDEILYSVNGGVSVPVTTTEVEATAFRFTKINTTGGKEGVNVSITLSARSSSGLVTEKTLDFDLFIRGSDFSY